MPNGRWPPGNGGGNQSRTDRWFWVATCAGLAAAFIWTDPIYHWTLPTFDRIARENYGPDVLPALRWLYWIGLHAAVFFTTRVAVEMALMVLATGAGLRLAGAF